MGNMEELTTPLLKCEPTNACGVVARALHCCLSLKTEGYRQGLPSSRPTTVGRPYVLSKKIKNKKKKLPPLVQ